MQQRAKLVQKQQTSILNRIDAIGAARPTATKVDVSTEIIRRLVLTTIKEQAKLVAVRLGAIPELQGVQCNERSQLLFHVSDAFIAEQPVHSKK